MTRYNYDANGNIIETIDALNHSSYFEYDEMNRLVRVELYRIDTLHNVDEQQVTLYRYDHRGLVTREINAAGNETIYVYDGNGNMVQKTDADGYSFRMQDEIGVIVDVYSSAGGFIILLFD